MLVQAFSIAGKARIQKGVGEKAGSKVLLGAELISQLWKMKDTCKLLCGHGRAPTSKKKARSVPQGMESQVIVTQVEDLMEPRKMIPEVSALPCIPQ